MSKSKQFLGIEQASIFDAIARRSADGALSQSCRIMGELQTALNLAIKKSTLSREQVAEEMSRLLGAPISRAQLDSWTCESKASRHIPAEYLPAFCVATGDSGPLDVLARAAGMFCVSPREALRSETQRLREEKMGLNQEIRRRERLLEMIGSDR